MPKLIRLSVIASILFAVPMLLAGCSSEDDPLTAPTNFTATYDTGVVHTTWEPGTGEEMFMVMRVEQNTDNTTVTWNVPNTETTYDDSTAVSGTTYKYMVHAMAGQDVSEPSNMVMITIP